MGHAAGQLPQHGQALLADQLLLSILEFLGALLYHFLQSLRVFLQRLLCPHPLGEFALNCPVQSGVLNCGGGHIGHSGKEINILLCVRIQPGALQLHHANSLAPDSHRYVKRRVGRDFPLFLRRWSCADAAVLLDRILGLALLPRLAVIRGVERPTYADHLALSALPRFGQGNRRELCDVYGRALVRCVLRLDELCLVIVRGDDKSPGIHQRLYVLVDGIVNFVEVSGFPQRKSQLVDSDLLIQAASRFFLRPSQAGYHLVERGGQLAHFILSLYCNTLTEVARVGNRPGSLREVLDGIGDASCSHDGDERPHPDGNQQDP